MLESLINILPSKLQATNAAEVKTRFAPSPTGRLHLGHIYAAKIAHDLALYLSGTYLLRFEDIDITRVKDEYYDSILDDLNFFNLSHKEAPISQLQEDRILSYELAINKLTELGVTYPCFCSRKDITRELSLLTNAPHADDSNIQHYPGTCKKLTSNEISQRLSEGKIPTIRIDADRAKELTGSLTFTDLIHGTIEVDHHILGDCILARRDIGTSYHLASVVDDAYQEITHVTRGDDLLESTHLHRIIQFLLELNEPIYLHHPLVVDNENKRLAKRAESTTIKELRNLGHSKSSLEQMINEKIQK